MVIKKKIIIEGSLVHGVSYRLFLLDEAEALILPYFSAKNIKKDRVELVEVLVGGETKNVDDFVEFVKTNFPEDAEVDSVGVEDYDDSIRTVKSYSRSFSASQLSKIAITGVSMLNIQRDMNKNIKELSEKQDKTLEKQDSALTKMDSMLDKQDSALEKQDLMLYKHDKTTKAVKHLSGSVDQNREEISTEVRLLRDDLKSHLDGMFKRIKTEVSNKS